MCQKLTVKRYSIKIYLGRVIFSLPHESNVQKKSVNYRVNSIAAHKFAKLVLLKAYNSIHKFHIIFIKETYLDSNISPNDSDLEIPRYNLVRCDHSFLFILNKNRGTCIYYNSYLPLRIIFINYLDECAWFELSDKLYNFIALYRSPGRSRDQFESYKENLELNLESAFQNNPLLVVLLGDFNVESSNWCKNDINTTEGESIESISSQFGLHQIINEPTYILEFSSS